MSPLSIAALLGLLAINAALVAAEFSLVRSRRDRLQDAVDEGKRGASAALRALTQLDDSLAVCQVGITMTSIGIGFLGEGTVGKAIVPSLQGPFGHSAAAILGLVFSYLVITAVQVTAGEQVPKLYAISNPEASARWLAGPLLAMHRVLRPVVWALSKTTLAVLRLLGVRGAIAREDELPSSAELDSLIIRARLAGRLDQSEAEMLAGVLDLHELTASQVMTPIFDMTSVSRDATVREALAVARDAGHSRVIVCDSDHGPAIGLVHVADLAWTLMEHGDGAPAVDSLRELLIIPEVKPLDELLEALKASHSSMALVVDEYGKAAGLVAIEDIVEEIVGEIRDETDSGEDGVSLTAEADGSLLVPGHFGLHDLHDHGLPNWTDAHDQTIGGLVFSALGRLPETGDCVTRDNYEMHVHEMDEFRVARVRIIPPPAEPPAYSDM